MRTEYLSIPECNKKPLHLVGAVFIFLSERVSGIGPPSLPWQGSIIATIRHPQFANFKLLTFNYFCPPGRTFTLLDNFISNGAGLGPSP